mgnify:CR=1 FL=1|jgi:transcriptional regulator with XRE-family HTH domain
MKTYKNDKALGQRIKAVIKRKKLVQESIAGRVGIHPSSLTRIIKGERPVDDDTLGRIAGAIGVSKDTLTAEPVEQDGKPAAPSGAQSIRAIIPEHSRLADSRRAFIGAHHDKPSKRDIEFLHGVNVQIEQLPDFAPASDSWWWQILDAFRAEEIKRRNGGEP